MTESQREKFLSQEQIVSLFQQDMLSLGEYFINPGMYHVMYNTGVQADGAQCSPLTGGSEAVRSGWG